MVALPYAEVGARTARIPRQKDIFDDVRLNWRLILALGVNVIVWIGVARLIEGLIA